MAKKNIFNNVSVRAMVHFCSDGLLKLDTNEIIICPILLMPSLAITETFGLSQLFGHRRKRTMQ